MRSDLEHTTNDNVIKWKHLLHDWPFVRGIHQSPVDCPLKDQWCGALMFSLICAWTNDWANNQDASNLRCHCTYYDVNVMKQSIADLCGWALGCLLSGFLEEIDVLMGLYCTLKFDINLLLLPYRLRSITCTAALSGMLLCYNDGKPALVQVLSPVLSHYLDQCCPRSRK